MPITEDVLIRITTVAGLQGVAAAQKSFLGLGASTLALAAVLGVLVKVGQDAVDNYGKQEEALNLLHQATDNAGLSFDKTKADVLGFIQAHKGAIANQYDLIAAMGQIVRAGHGETESLRILNDALDLAAILHEDVSVSATTMIKVLAGNSKALKALGITTEQYNTIMKSKLSVEEKDAALLDLIEKRTAHGRDTVDSRTAAERRLNTDWENFTARIGPGVVWMLDQITTALDTGVQILDLYVQLFEKLGKLAGGNYGTSAATQQAVANSMAASSGHQSGGVQHLQHGGVVRGAFGQPVPVIAHGGEVVTPAGGSLNGGGGGGVHYHFHVGTFVSSAHALDQLANELLRAGRHRPGT